MCCPIFRNASLGAQQQVTKRSRFRPRHNLLKKENTKRKKENRHISSLDAADRLNSNGGTNPRSIININHTPKFSSFLNSYIFILRTSATSSTGKDARSTPPGFPWLSFQHQTPSVGFSLEDLNDHNQVHPMTNTAAWLTELEEVHVDSESPSVSIHLLTLLNREQKLFIDKTQSSNSAES